MPAGNTAERARFVELVQWLASWSWPVDQDAAQQLSESHGWTLLHQKSGGGGVYDTGLLAERGWASFRIMDGLLDDVSITTAFFAADDSSRSSALTDTFADQVEAVTEVLGTARVRTPGVDGSALWDLPNGAMLNVGRTDRSTSWKFISPSYAEVQRDLGR